MRQSHNLAKASLTGRSLVIKDHNVVDFNHLLRIVSDVHVVVFSSVGATVTSISKS